MFPNIGMASVHMHAIKQRYALDDRMN